MSHSTWVHSRDAYQQYSQVQDEDCSPKEDGPEKAGPEEPAPGEATHEEAAHEAAAHEEDTAEKDGSEPNDSEKDWPKEEASILSDSHGLGGVNARDSHDNELPQLNISQSNIPPSGNAQKGPKTEKLPNQPHYLLDCI
jgi:hypothetical protein